GRLYCEWTFRSPFKATTTPDTVGKGGNSISLLKWTKSSATAEIFYLVQLFLALGRCCRFSHVEVLGDLGDAQTSRTIWCQLQDLCRKHRQSRTKQDTAPSPENRLWK
ncbi:hypothetical protein scyTo_0017664, partial [Scyliorhinus torazame]|nr:hypothetical protein [Scyliorhinus torazame]